MRNLCFGLPPKGSVYLIAIIDIILGFVGLLLSIVALLDLQKVFGPLDPEFDEDDPFGRSNHMIIQSGIEKFAHLHGQMVLCILISGLYLILALGLFWGIRKEWDWALKSWLIYSCVLTLLSSITLCVIVIVSNEILFSLLLLLPLTRAYEIVVVLNYLKQSRFYFNNITSSRTSSIERLHNV